MTRLRRRCGALLLGAGLAVAGAGPAAAAAPACFGAAARDPLHPCSNPTMSVVPALDADDDGRSARCTPVDEEPAPVCTFGWSGRRPRAEIALVGDSHALHWRTALAVVARAKRWRGHSITTAGCLFSAANDDLPVGAREPCANWQRKVLRWFRGHPEVSTVFVSQTNAMPVTAPPDKQDALKIAGYRQTFRALPRTVKRVIVIRDTPQTSAATRDCLRQAVAAGTQPPGPACPEPRATAVANDTAAAAARSLRARRYRVVDLTDYFCDPDQCFAVIGGVRVYADVYGHITHTYSRTLGPYLLRAVRRVLRAR